MILSILICSLHSRENVLATLLDHLNKQISFKYDGQVEVVVLVDNKEMSTGKKRQTLLEMAKGEYTVFIDDDDWVPFHYIDSMLKAVSSGCDCVAINGIMSTDGKNIIKWFLSKDNENITVNENKFGQPFYLRKTNHITAVKRELALKAGFPDKSNAEDKAYSDAVAPLLKTEYVIEKPMYHYRYSTLNKEY